MVTAFESLASEQRWVNWRNEQSGDRVTKVPYQPDARHAKSDDPNTWTTRTAVEAGVPNVVNGLDGGIGIVLGDLGDGTGLGGIDLDTCRNEDGTLEAWAVEVITKFSSYTEVSPSRTGVKIFFRYRTDDLAPVLLKLGLNEKGRQRYGCSFKRTGTKNHPPGIEIYLGFRYFAVTDQHLEWTSGYIATIAPEKLLWLLTECGPAFADIKPEAGGGARTNSKDNSRSAKAMRVAAKMKRAGATFGEMCDAIRTDPETAEWYREQGNSKRQLQRIWDRVQDAGRNLPIIKIAGGGLPAIVDRVDELVVEHDPELFQRGGMIVRPAMEKIDIADGGQALAWRLIQVRQQHLVDRLTRIIDFQKYDKRSDEWYSINCPPEVAGAYLERVGLWRLPIVTGIVDAPTLRPDGSIIEAPGYDPATGLLYKPSREYKPIFPNPTKANAKAALKHLCELIAKFPFVDDRGEPAAGKSSASRSVAVSLILTSSARHAIARAPLHGFDAPVPGSGKSLLVDTASMIASGH